MKRPPDITEEQNERFKVLSPKGKKRVLQRLFLGYTVETCLRLSEHEDERRKDDDRPNAGAEGG